MRARWTNLLLFVFLVAALVSGALAFGTGAASGRPVVAAHGAAGFAVVALAPWKSVVVCRGLRRRSSGRVCSVVLLVLVTATVVSGAAHAAGARALPIGLATMQVHVGVALASVPLGGWHVARRRVRPRTTDLSRRSVLRVGTVRAAGAALWLGGEGLWRLAALPGAHRRFTGSHEVGSGRPYAMPVTQWLTDGVPAIDRGTWRLDVTDADGTRTLGIENLPALDDHVRAVLDCTGGWFAEQLWTGVRLDRLVHPAPGDRSVLVRSVTGYAWRLAVDDLTGLLLATHVGGRDLSPGHGFPARAGGAGSAGLLVGEVGHRDPR